MDIREKTIEHLQNVGNATKQICPTISKYCKLLSQAKKPENCTETKNGFKKHNTCVNCGNAFFPNNCRVRLHARPVLTKKMKKLISRHQRQPWALRRAEREKISAFKTCHNKIVYQCLKCNVYTEFNGSRVSKIPQTANSTPAVLYCPRIRKKKKKEINAGLRYSLNDSQASLDLNRSVNSPFPSFTETPINKNKFVSKNKSPISNETSFMENSINSAEKSAKTVLERISSTPKPNKKHRDSLLQQMLKQDEEKKQLSSSSLSSFLSSL